MGKKRKHQRQRELSGADRASQQDKAWFEAHPGVNVYLRPEILGEFPAFARDESCHTVLVTQLRPGSRWREQVPDGISLQDAVILSRGDPVKRDISRIAPELGLPGGLAGDEMSN